MRFLLLFIFWVPLISCSSSEGFLGYGTDPQKIRTYTSTPVFSADETVYWVFQLKSLPSPNLFGVKLERNELGWLRIETVSLMADQEFKVISSQYPPMKPGLYKITIFHNQEILSTSMFRLVAATQGLY